MQLINFHPGRRHAVSLALSIAAALLVGLVLASARAEANTPATFLQPNRGGVPRPDHVIVAIEENHSYSQIIGSPLAPYINGLVQQGALFTNSHGVEHPSQPNYLDLFSGSNQGITNDSCPHTFSTANLGSELLGAGLGFTGYSEDLPSPGSTVCSSGYYARKHNPWVNFTNVPAAYNLPFTSFPSDYTALPTIGFVVPNQLNDMHDGTIQQGDTWLQQHIDSYVQWARTHNSLLILTWDEDDFTSSNRIPTIFVGSMVVTGQYGESINHYNLLRTMEDMYDLPYAGNSGSVQPITDVWASGGTATPIPTSLPTDTLTPTNLPTDTLTPTSLPTDTTTPTYTPTRAFTSTNTPTPASTATPEPVLVGHVTWQGRPAQPNALQQLPVTLTLKLGTTEVNYPIQTTDASGFFTVSIGSLASGTYDWRVKGPQFLANSGQVQLSVRTLERWNVRTLLVPNVPTSQRSNVLTISAEMGLMKPGDCNDDNAVNVSDFNILKATFGKTIGQPGYDARADFTGDNAVNVSDFNLLKVNFGIPGAPPIGPR